MVGLVVGLLDHRLNIGRVGNAELAETRGVGLEKVIDLGFNVHRQETCVLVIVDVDAKEGVDGVPILDLPLVNKVLS